MPHGRGHGSHAYEQVVWGMDAAASMGGVGQQLLLDLRRICRRAPVSQQASPDRPATDWHPVVPIRQAHCIDIRSGSGLRSMRLEGRAIASESQRLARFLEPMSQSSDVSSVAVLYSEAVEVRRLAE